MARQPSRRSVGARPPLSNRKRREDDLIATCESQRRRPPQPAHLVVAQDEGLVVEVVLFAGGLSESLALRSDELIAGGYFGGTVDCGGTSMASVGIADLLLFRRVP